MKLSISILFALTINFSIGQTISFPWTHDSVVYTGGANILEIKIHNHSCKSVIISTNNGQIRELDHEECRYSLIPVDTGEVILIFKSKGKREKLGEVKLIVKETIPAVIIGMQFGGQVSKNLVSGMTGAYFNSNNFGCTNFYHFEADSFLVQIFRNENMIFEKSNRGNHFDPEITAALSDVRKGDRLLFSNIVGHNLYIQKIFGRAGRFEIVD